MWLFDWLFGKKNQIDQDNDKGVLDRVLLVGINKYPGAPLSGCVNDILNAKGMLISDFGFNGNNMRILTDSGATTTAIINGLVWLSGTPTGGRAYFHYSGHGAQVPCRIEPDGLSEVICPVDFNWAPQHMVTDKQFVAIFGKMQAGVKFNWCSDSCHSGDLDRDMVPGHINHPRQMVPPPHIQTEINERKKRGGKSRGIVNGTLDVGFVSGCRSNQTSADTAMNNVPCGAFTYFFVKNLKANKSKSLKFIVALTVQDLSRNGYSQTPQSEGTRQELPFLG